MTNAAPAVPHDLFRHEALFYRGLSDFLAQTVAFVREGVDAAEAVLVAVAAHKIEAMRAALGAEASSVTFVDMSQLGVNPARIIPAWVDFLDEVPAGQGARGIGEPITADRPPLEIDECLLHERLLNVAFEDGRPWRLACPYDLDALAPSVVDGARDAHPSVIEAGTVARSARYVPSEAVGLDVPLPDPPVDAAQLLFNATMLVGVREVVQDAAGAAGLGLAKSADLVLAASEAATNSVRHAGSEGVLRIWIDDRGLNCEISDAGRIDERLVGRIRPDLDAEGGRGLWLINQLCDFVQVRSSGAGTTVRMQMRLS
ncbi:MAG: anti-sigma factor RsbA family regulatory protein [Acidimicrobiales bacterium]